MKKHELFAATALTMFLAAPAMAQSAPVPPENQPSAPAVQDPSVTPQAGAAANAAAAGETQDYGTDIVVTAQRQSERLQDVPIAVSAFNAQALERQQIVNPAALQLTLPSITFTKTNFTTSSFTIRGIGDLCTGATCDQATGIHVNDMPLLSTRLFETEFFDLERVEVLRGPQGTLFGRNATSGVVNFITARPDLSGIHAAGEAEYGNYDSVRLRGMINLPLTDTMGIRVAGLYLTRAGYTYNSYNNDRIDDRNLYSVRGTLSWEPDANTRVDLIGYYFHERDNRSRIQKQLCHRDPTGILGCLPDRTAYETFNGNSTLAGVQTSREFLSIASGGLLTNFGLGSVYGADAFAGVTNPNNVRTVRTDYDPTYYAEEQQYTLRVYHDFGRIKFQFTGGYAENEVDSTSDYNLAVENRYVNNPGLFTLAGTAAAPRAAFPGGVNPFTRLAGILIPNGPNGNLCQSAPTPNDGGVYSGASLGCFPQSLDVDRSNAETRQYSAEAHINSSFDGMFNFLLGGIYLNSRTRDNSYYISNFGLDYAAGLLGAANTGGAAIFATPFYRNDTDLFRLSSYGVFGETYFQFTPALKLTLGLRYNHDNKYVRARNTYFVDANGVNPILPIGATNLSQAINYAGLDFNGAVTGLQPFAEDRVQFSRLTGRAVLDYRITPDHLLYASYSRGYKSGGINPPIAGSFAVPTTFRPEQVDAVEVGSKNTFGHGQFRFNLTGFYYRYRDLQLSRIVARTSVNDNINADIYGVEAEAIMSPTRNFQVNANFSYLDTRVVGDRFLSDPRDPSGGRSDAVIIKDITNASNCAVTATGGAAIARAYVNTINAGINASIPGNTAPLQGAQPLLANGTYGAYSLCSTLQSNAPTAGALFGGIQFYGSGVPVNLHGNQLPQAPRYKASIGAQWTIPFHHGWTVVPRADLAYTGESYASIFNDPIDRLPGYEVVNAQIQVNGPNEAFYVRAFVQNLTANDAITGQYVTDQSSGLFTNIFTIEPRRYGVAAGFRF